MDSANFWFPKIGTYSEGDDIEDVEEGQGLNIPLSRDEVMLKILCTSNVLNPTPETDACVHMALGKTKEERLRAKVNLLELLRQKAEIELNDLKEKVMEWMLTDKEMRCLDADFVGFTHTGNIHQWEKLVAQAQAKKLVEWLGGICYAKGHKPLHDEDELFTRLECLTCLEELRRQVGLDVKKTRKGKTPTFSEVFAEELKKKCRGET